MLVQIGHYSDFFYSQKVYAKIAIKYVTIKLNFRDRLISETHPTITSLLITYEYL